MSSEYERKLATIRLMAMPADVSLSIGGFGTFNREQLAKELGKKSPAGEAAVRLELEYLRKSAHINEWLRE